MELTPPLSPIPSEMSAPMAAFSCLGTRRLAVRSRCPVYWRRRLHCLIPAAAHRAITAQVAQTQAPTTQGLSQATFRRSQGPIHFLRPRTPSLLHRILPMPVATPWCLGPTATFLPMARSLWLQAFTTCIASPSGEDREL